MAADINVAVLDEFQALTSQDVKQFLTDANNFLQTSYNRIVLYYQGQPSQVQSGDFKVFDNLRKRTESMLATFRIQGNVLKNLKFWLLLDHIENVDSRLASLYKINKWSKSSLTNFGYDPAQQAAYTLKAHQTLERVSQDVLNNTTPDDDWVQIAINNNLKEEDYTVQGGSTVLLSFPNVNNGVSVSAVVAVMVGNAILGTDFDKATRFDPVTQDLAVLSPEDTVQQSMQILANLRKNDNPDFPQYGLQSSVVVGGTRASLNFPVISRQLTETFASDDTFKNFTITQIGVINDTLSIAFTVQTRLNETVDGLIKV